MIEHLSLRRAVAADAGAVLALTRMAYAKWVPLIGREPKPMTADYERAVAEHIIDLWEEGGELLALIEMIPEADCLLVENIAVRPGLQGKASATNSCTMPNVSRFPWVLTTSGFIPTQRFNRPSVLCPSRVSGVSAGGGCAR